MPEKLKKRTLGYRICNSIINLFFWSCILFICWIILRIFVYSTFTIPSDSMEPTLIAGDRVIVCKPVLGARLLNQLAALQGKDVEIHRIPGFRKVKRNDVLVFNFPHTHSWDSLRMDIKSYYIKRCIGIPGDTVEIRNGFYRINGKEGLVGNQDQQAKLSASANSDYPREVFHTFPYHGPYQWTIKEFGPLQIPGRNKNIPLNQGNIHFYKSLIEWECQKKIAIEKDHITLDSKPLRNYCFQKNYYFMAGDRVENSKDSRYWGLLPEECIVGKAWLIWNPHQKGRLLKTIE